MYICLASWLALFRAKVANAPIYIYVCVSFSCANVAIIIHTWILFTMLTIGKRQEFEKETQVVLSTYTKIVIEAGILNRDRGGPEQL